jgi:hypothetical protein
MWFVCMEMSRADRSKLEKQVKELKEKSKDNEYLIKAKLEEKDEEIQILKRQMTLMQESHKEILKCLKYPEKLAKIAKEG